VWPNKSARNSVRKAVDESGLLNKYLGVETGSCSREFRHLASDGIANSSQSVTSDFHEAVNCKAESPGTMPDSGNHEHNVFYSLSEIGPGMRIRIQTTSDGVVSSRYARCGGILLKDELYYAFTAAHTLEYRRSVIAESEDFEFELNDHSDTEDLNELVRITSRGSSTPENFESAGEVVSSDSDLSRCQYPKPHGTTQNSKMETLLKCKLLWLKPIVR
jgi:hypothetical protein